MGHRDVKTAMHYQYPELEIVRAAHDYLSPTIPVPTDNSHPSELKPESPLLMVACVLAAAGVGWFKGQRWAYWLASAIIATQALGDIVNLL